VLIREGRAIALLQRGDPPELIRLERGAMLDDWQLVEVRESSVTLRSGSLTRELGLAPAAPSLPRR
jgi:hypothetical protein